MPTLQLFGATYDVNAASRTWPLGAASLSLRLDAAGPRVEVILDGDFAGLRFRALAFAFPCTVAGSAISLTPGDATWTGDVDLLFGGVTAPLRLTHITAPAPEPEHGIAINTSQAAVFRAAVVEGGPGALVYYDWQLAWTSSLFSPDAASGAVDIWPRGGPASLTIIDRFASIAKQKVQQVLAIERMRMEARAFEVLFWPSAGALFLNPDVLDPTRPLDDAGNALHYQHVAAESHLVGRFTHGGAAWANAGWSLAPAARKGGAIRLAAPVLKDEHGHPLIFSVDQRLPLSMRSGHVKPQADPLGTTNQGLVIGDLMAKTSFKARMETLDPITLYAAPRKPPKLQNLSLPTPYWVQGRATPLQSARPRQVLGLASDAVLSLDAAISGGLAGPRPPHEVTLSFDPVRDDARGLRFMFPTVDVPLQTTGGSAMSYALDLPEQATLQTLPDGTKSLEISRRVSTAGQASLTLPLLDAKWAFSDLGSAPVAGDSLAEQGGAWLKGLDKQARAAFARPTPRNYEHIEGLRVAPNELPAQRIFAPAPSTSRRPDGTFDDHRVGLSPTVLAIDAQPAIAPPTSGGPASLAPLAPVSHAQFLFGGPPGGVTLLALAGGGPPAALTPLEQAAQALKDGRTAFSGPLEDFFWFWIGDPRGALPPEPDWRAARLALWDYLVGLRPKLPNPDDWSFEDLIDASERLEAARDTLASNPPGVLGFELYDDALTTAAPDEVAELLDPDRGSGLVDRLLQYSYAPPTMELANRALAALTALTLRDHLPILQTFVTGKLQDAITDYFKGDKAPKGLFAELLQGLPPIFEKAQEIWRDRDQLAGEAREALQDLAARYGAELTHEVYAELLKAAADSDAFLTILRDYGLPLARLADLAGEPPDYLIVSRKLRRPESGDPNADPSRLHPIDRAAALWNHRFDFCQFGGGKAWDMFLDDQTTMIVKLGGSRGLPAILKEAAASYAEPGRSDPFGLDPTGGKDPVAAFVALLPDEIQQPDWRGALIVNPKIDLERDPVLKTLCGFSHLAARFAAVGGRSPDGLPVELDIWGRIEKSAEAAGWTDPDGKPEDTAPSWGKADVAWSLIRFNATVKGTSILAGDISFKLDVRELFGRRFDWPSITVAGTLPPTNGSMTGKPRDFTFAATFDTPLTLEIQVAFIDKVKLKGIRVGSHDRDTTLDIDAQMLCRDWAVGGFKLEAPKSLDLSDFRIRIPEVEAGRAVAMGLMRRLSFDLRGIRFPIGDARRITLAGLDIRPVGVGLLRGKRDEILSSLHSETVPLVEPDFGGGPADLGFGYPYLDTRVEFGRTPALDGAGQFSLVARAGVPVQASNDPGQLPQFGKPGVGLASLSGKNLKFSLFRLVTLEFESLEAGVFDINGGKQAGVIWSEGFNLSLLSWPLFKKDDDPKKKSARTLVYAHDTKIAENRGFLAFYAAPGPATGFFKLQWLLIGQNINPGATLYNGLLSLTGSDLTKEIAAIRALKAPGKLNVDIDRKFGWLFGIRFELGDLFKPCVLIFQDGVYYGIRLGGPVAKLITGEEDISLAYIPGDTPSLDRFRVALRIAALDMLGVMKSGEISLEWNPAWDFLIDLGQPWRGPNGYMWERAFSIPMGVYEAKFGFFVEKRTSVKPPEGLPPAPAGYEYITLSAGAGFYFGYRFATPKGIAWVAAGIGVFGVMIGSATLRAPDNIGNNPLALLKTSLAKLSVTGVLGIYAYGEGGIDVWIISASFRVSAQAFVEVVLVYIPSARSYLTYSAVLAAAYSASVRVGSGMFSWTFSVSGAVQMQIAGSASFG